MALRHDIVMQVKVGILRDLPLGERFMHYQLVGGVTAYQGDDG